MPFRRFDGAGDNVRWGAGTSGPSTMCCWFRVPNTTSRYTLMSMGRSGTTDHLILELCGDLAGDPVRYIARRHSSGIVASSSTQGTGAINPRGFVANKWLFAAGVTVSNSDRRVYLIDFDKSISTHTTTTSSTLIGVTGTRVGESEHNGGQDLLGDIAYPHLYTRAITDYEDLLSVAFFPFSVRKGLYLAWRFAGENPETDFAEGLARNGTVTGTTPVNFGGPPVQDYWEKPTVRPFRPAMFGSTSWIDGFVLGKAPAGAGNTISVPLATLTLTAQTPTVTATANQTISAPAGSLTLSALAPTITTSAGVTVDVPAASLSLTAQTPTVTTTANQTVAVPAASLTLSGQTPIITVTADQTVDVPAGSLLMTTYAPTITSGANTLIAVPAASLDLDTFAPAVSFTSNQFARVSLGTLTLNRFAPEVTDGGVIVAEGIVPILRRRRR